MPELQNELTELRTYVKLLRDERKRSEERETWTRWVTLSIVFLAVGAALAFQQYGNFSGRGMRQLNYAAIEQGKANDQWAYYQAVSIKLHLYRFELGRRQEKAAGVAAAAGKTALGKLVDAKIRKYERQKKEIQAQARAFEARRDEHRKRSDRSQRHTAELTLALAVLQVAIAVASIALLSRKKPLWLMSLAIGAFGIFQTFNGMFLWLA